MSPQGGVGGTHIHLACSPIHARVRPVTDVHCRLHQPAVPREYATWQPLCGAMNSSFSRWQSYAPSRVASGRKTPNFSLTPKSVPCVLVLSLSIAQLRAARLL